MKENIEYSEKANVNVGQGKRLLTMMHIPNTASSHGDKMHQTQGLPYSYFFRLHKECEWSRKCWTTNHGVTRRLHFVSCLYLELFKLDSVESTAWWGRRLEKLYFTDFYAVEDFIAFSAYALQKHKSFCPLFYEDTCGQRGENNTRILRSQNTLRRLPVAWPLHSESLSHV